MSKMPGFFVMRSGVVANDTSRKLSATEFQGFAIADKVAPLVFINSADFKTAQLFTLAHELAHIWSGTSGISSPDPVDIEQKNQIEVFCNKVASEVLVPSVEFNQAWRTTDNLDTLARRFRVSTLVVLVRAYELKKISLSDFLELRTVERTKQKGKGSGGGDYYRNVNKFLSDGDPWVIAHAMEDNGIAVTHETERNDEWKIKIPVVC